MNNIYLMTIDPSKELPGVEKIIYNLAWKYATTYPVTFEECLSEGYVEFMRCCSTYDPKRGSKFSSWVYFCVWCKLKDLVMKRSKDPLDFVPLDDLIFGAAPHERNEAFFAEQSEAFLDLVQNLSQDAQEIIHLLIETSGEILGMAPIPPHRLWKRVRAHLIVQGKEITALDHAQEEIRAWLHKMTVDRKVIYA